MSLRCEKIIREACGVVSISELQPSFSQATRDSLSRRAKKESVRRRGEAGEREREISISLTAPSAPPSRLRQIRCPLCARSLEKSRRIDAVVSLKLLERSRYRDEGGRRRGGRIRSFRGRREEGGGGRGRIRSRSLRAFFTASSRRESQPDGAAQQQQQQPRVTRCEIYRSRETRRYRLGRDDGDGSLCYCIIIAAARLASRRRRP